MTILTTGQKTPSLEEGIAHLREYVVRENTGICSYALLMQEEDGTYTLYERTSMPCWGALREYECGTRPKDPWPGDLRTDRHIFPKTGNPVAVAARTRCPPPTAKTKSTAISPVATIEGWNKFYEFVFNPDISPWRGALKNAELVKNTHGAYAGCVILDTHIDPNIMIALFRQTMNGMTTVKNWEVLMDSNPNLDPRVAYLQILQKSYGLGYYFNPRINISNFMNGLHDDISGGKTFFDRESYNRPDISFIFGGKSNTGEVFSNMSVEQLTAAIGG